MLTRLPLVLSLLALLFTAFAAWSFVEWRSLAFAGNGNQALVSTAESSKVIGQVTTALEKTLSYDYSKPDANAQAVKDYLIGDAVKQHEESFKSVKAGAQDKKRVVTATVRAIGIKQLRGDHAELLVFVDQQLVEGDAQPILGPAQATIGATQVDGNWKISGINSK
ncbi:hypothetical protein D5S17_30145 [Pseudonocardiaceae bacterium YIM PH 21723]|nr:hypothetical protein D5S17_30145 [Pseudonocardiaceae bacterium YIM PH 21723]